MQLLLWLQAKNFQDLPTTVLNQVRDKLGYITETVSFATEYISKMSVINWLVGFHFLYTLSISMFLFFSFLAFVYSSKNS